jgi:hypothetical protein
MTPDANDAIYELEELVMQPGTYFNPQTEMVVVVDDSISVAQDVFDMEAFEGAEWVRISDEVPVDEHSLEESMERFQTRHHGHSFGSLPATVLELDDDETLDDDPGELEPDPDPED